MILKNKDITRKLQINKPKTIWQLKKDNQEFNNIIKKSKNSQINSNKKNKKFWKNTDYIIWKKKRNFKGKNKDKLAKKLKRKPENRRNKKKMKKRKRREKRKLNQRKSKSKTRKKANKKIKRRTNKTKWRSKWLKNLQSKLKKNLMFQPLPNQR